MKLTTKRLFEIAEEEYATVGLDALDEGAAEWAEENSDWEYNNENDARGELRFRIIPRKYLEKVNAAIAKITADGEKVNITKDWTICRENGRYHCENKKFAMVYKYLGNLYISISGYDDPERKTVESIIVSQEVVNSKFRKGIR